MQNEHPSALPRTAGMQVLAAVGFIALVGAGIYLAILSTRYVPSVVNRIGAAAVYLGSVFVPAENPVPTVPGKTPIATTTPTVPTASSTPTATTTPPTTKPVTPGTPTTVVLPIGGTAPATPTGLPDLIATINAVGYLATSSAESFVATSTLSSQTRPAIRFTIKNIGSGATGPWCFSATIPTASHYLFQSQPQQSLAPGDSIDYTLGFDQAYRGVDQMISVSANIANPSNTATCSRAITESSTANNSAFAKITIQ